jgi:hypothetical protein
VSTVETTSIRTDAPLRHQGPRAGARVHRAPSRAPERTLQLEVVAGGDPARLARILATMVNNSPMALAEVHVGERHAYPVPDRTVVTHRGPVRLTLHLRDRSRRLDALVVEEVVALVSSMCRVVHVERS